MRFGNSVLFDVSGISGNYTVQIKMFGHVHGMGNLDTSMRNFTDFDLELRVKSYD